jgi:hypothetical protein
MDLRRRIYRNTCFSMPKPLYARDEKIEDEFEFEVGPTG